MIIASVWIGFGYSPDDWRKAVRVAALLCEGLFGAAHSVSDYLEASWMLIPLAFFFVFWRRRRGSLESRVALVGAALYGIGLGWYCQAGMYI
ncbi:MAG: hypothetical protein ABI183_00650 [Polyangiaceae bacterium]